MKAIIFAVFITTFAFILPGALYATDESPLHMRMKTFSHLTFHKTEGEFNGIQVSIVPYSGGTKILWRSGSGRLDQPLLLSPTQEGNVFKVTIPDSNDMFGEWSLTLKGKALTAQGPRGLHFNLKEVRQ